MRHTKDSRGFTYWDALPVEVGQVNVSTTFPQQIRAFHLHKSKEDHIFVLSGQFMVVIGEGEESTTKWQHPKYLGVGDSLTIPRGLWHGYQCVSPDSATMVYYETEKSGPDADDDHYRPASDFEGWV